MEDLKKKQADFDQSKGADERKLKDLLKRAEEDRSNIDHHKRLLADKQSKLDTDRKNYEAEVQKKVESVRATIADELKRAESQKLMIVAAICLVIGMVLPMIANK